MLHEQTKDHVSNLSDAELLEYVMTGVRMYEPDAIAFAKSELDRRALSPESAAALRPGITAKIMDYDTRHPPELDGYGARSAPILCQECGVEAPTKFVQYHQNIGAVIVTYHQTYAGHYCKHCNNRIFWTSMVITSIFGWWGIVSFFATIGNLFGNVATYGRSRSLPPPSRDAIRPTLNAALVEKLAPHISLINQRLEEGLDPCDVAREAAPRASVTPGQALCYVEAILRQKVGGDPEAAEPTRGFPVVMRDAASIHR